MVAIAKRMFPEIRFKQGDAHDLPFEDASFDRVLMNFGLLHVSNQKKHAPKRAAF
jgi:ubiquinone/menaquinone biosynthesis C-methylase UbiE